MIELILPLTAVFTSAVTGIMGFGGGVVLLVVMLMFLPPAVALPVHGAVQLVSNLTRATLFRQHIRLDLVAWFAPLLIPGAALGIWLFQGLSEAEIKILIGAFALFSLVYRKFRSKGKGNYPKWSFTVLGFVVGVLSVTVGAVGYLFAVFMLRDDMEKEAMNGTNAAMSALAHTAKLLAFGSVGFDFGEHLVLIGLIAPAVMAGTALGRGLLTYFSQSAFLILYQIFLAGLALRLLVWEGILQMF